MTNPNETQLSALKLNQTATVTDVDCPGARLNRLQSFGLRKGARVTALFRSPFGDPTAYLVKGAVIALRKCDCDGITVCTEDENE